MVENFDITIHCGAVFLKMISFFLPVLCNLDLFLHDSLWRKVFQQAYYFGFLWCSNPQNNTKTTTTSPYFRGAALPFKLLVNLSKSPQFSLWFGQIQYIFLMTNELLCPWQKDSLNMCSIFLPCLLVQWTNKIFSLVICIVFLSTDRKQPFSKASLSPY